MNYALGIPKRLKVVLEEREVDTCHMNPEEMQETLSSHSEFMYEKNKNRKVLF